MQAHCGVARMDVSLVVGLLFAVGTAIATNLAFLWKHRGAVAAPAVELRHPVRSAAELFRSKWWAIGWAGAVVACPGGDRRWVRRARRAGGANVRLWAGAAAVGRHRAGGERPGVPRRD